MSTTQYSTHDLIAFVEAEIVDLAAALFIERYGAIYGDCYDDAVRQVPDLLVFAAEWAQHVRRMREGRDQPCSSPNV